MVGFVFKMSIPGLTTDKDRTFRSYMIIISQKVVTLGCF